MVKADGCSACGRRRTPQSTETHDPERADGPAEELAALYLHRRSRRRRNLDCTSVLKTPEVYRDALGRVSVAGSPARREPWRAPAVEDGIQARDRGLPLAGSTRSAAPPRGFAS